MSAVTETPANATEDATFPRPDWAESVKYASERVPYECYSTHLTSVPNAVAEVTIAVEQETAKNAGWCPRLYIYLNGIQVGLSFDTEREWRQFMESLDMALSVARRDLGAIDA